jgi:uncharacterized protein (UPF0332 family)
MSEENKQSLITYHLKRARETYQDALLLLNEGGSSESIINRSYYAMFYSVLALLTSQDLSSSKHSGVISIFDQHFVKTKRLPEEMSKVLHKAFDIRQIGDYRELFDTDREQALEILKSADDFINSIEKYLSQ